jgi:DNA-binding LacI/PurR family transcriptional regulator
MKANSATVMIAGTPDGTKIRRRTCQELAPSSIPLAEIGRRAAAQVRQLIDAGQSGNGEVDLVPAELVERNTA